MEETHGRFCEHLQRSGVAIANAAETGIARNLDVELVVGIRADIALLIDRHPHRAELYSIRAEIEAEQHQPELALLDLNKAIQLEPSNRNMVLTRAYLYLKEGKKHLAKQDFLRAIQLGVPRGQLKEELKQCK